MTILWMVGRAETQRIQCCNRPCAHCEHIAQNTTDTGSRTLIGFDIGWMVVALHFEDASQAITNINHAGIFAGALNDPRRFGWQALQMKAR